MDRALGSIADHVEKAGCLVYNPTSFVQSGPVSCNGEAWFAADVPPHGWKVLDGSEAVSSAVTASRTCLENELFRMEFDENMNFSSIYDKRCGREVLKPGGRGNVLTAYEDKPHNYDAWEINIYYTEKQWEIDDVETVTVLADNGVYGGVEIRRRFLDSVIEQRILLYRGLDRIDFETRIDWKQDHILLKTAFEVDVLSDYATYEIQYGNVRRPTHHNTSWDAAKFEVCAHKWADLSEDGYGVAILNDCKYGHDIHDGVIRLSLLKSATYPNPNADKEEHRFTYALMPHEGDYRTAGVVQAAYALNNPFYVKAASGGGSLEPRFSFAQASCENVVIEVVKQAEKGEDLILRLYEAYGRRCRTSVTLPKAIESVWETDLLERPCTQLEADGEQFSFEIRPFEIKTFAIKF